MEYVYQIKLADGSDLSRPTLAVGIIECNSKQEVCQQLQERYPEYFDGNKVAQKLTKKSEQLVYVTIYELDDYWSGYWKQEVECKVCGKKVQLVDIRNHLGHIDLSAFACSLECQEQLPDVLEKYRAAQSEEYWNSRCDYYYIYKITHKLTGRCYVGYTEREVIFRWWEHIKHSDLPIGRALRSELENFTFEILEKHEKSTKTISEMHEIETAYILKYDSINNGYNCVVSKSAATGPITSTVQSKPLFDISAGGND